MADGSTFAQAFTILFREGLEALLVVAALAAFLRRAGAADRIRPVYAGAGLAVVASLGMAWVFEAFFDGNHNDLIEAGVIVVAAGLMFMMSGWLFLRQDPAAWKAELNRMAERAMGAGTVVSLAGIAFLAVFREGAETVLFVHALARTAGGFDVSLLSGLAVAALALAVVFVAMQWLALRLPLRPVFLLTSAFLFVMGLRLVGAAIQELQEQVIVPVHNDGVPDLVTTLGFNGSWEALGVQGAIVLCALGWLVVRRSRAAAPAARVPGVPAH
ncbi:FTR1 family iron permease [Methylobacterium nonmethylotrophicum]|uniref:Iron permease FTR1 n=1 Tax=Methylobacterium nonmethylotrophicum TaxID=1141884 RepID=A0A4Z0NDX4_9HYPH|nr:FTR1 family protein [Methylobacterium nonmethylotrophicum]TGD93890.1 iron permease FTR1 [Methylobacterium nonmethylotrophicum]